MNKTKEILTKIGHSWSALYLKLITCFFNNNKLFNPPTSNNNLMLVITHICLVKAKKMSVTKVRTILKVNKLIKNNKL